MATNNVYTVGKTDSDYDSVQDALREIVNDAPSEALVLVYPDHYDSGGTITFPDLDGATGGTTRVIIQGFGRYTNITDDIDVSNLSTMATPASAPTSEDTAQLVLRNLQVGGRIYGTKTTTPYGGLFIDDCIIKSSESTDPLIDLDASAGGGWYFFAQNSSFINFGTVYVMEFQGYADTFVENCNICLYNSATGTAVYFGGTPSTNMRRFDGCKIDVQGSTTGYAFDASAAINLFLMRSDYRRANGANVTLAGSSGSNQVWTVDFIYD